MSSDKILANSPANCPCCGAKMHSDDAALCWLCQAEFGVQQGTTPPAQPDQEPLRSFKLPAGSPDYTAWTALGILVLLLCAALAFSWPGLLILFAILATPVFMRLLFTLRPWQEPEVGPSRASPDVNHGIQVGLSRPQNLKAKPSALTTLGGVVGGLIAIMFAGVASFVAFFATCTLVMMSPLGERFSGNAFVASMGIGLVVGLIVAVISLRCLLPRNGSSN